MCSSAKVTGILMKLIKYNYFRTTIDNKYECAEERASGMAFRPSPDAPIQTRPGQARPPCIIMCLSVGWSVNYSAPGLSNGM